MDIPEKFAEDTSLRVSVDALEKHAGETPIIIQNRSMAILSIRRRTQHQSIKAWLIKSHSIAIYKVEDCLFIQVGKAAFGDLRAQARVGKSRLRSSPAFLGSGCTCANLCSSPWQSFYSVVALYSNKRWWRRPASGGFLWLCSRVQQALPRGVDPSAKASTLRGHRKSVFTGRWPHALAGH